MKSNTISPEKLGEILSDDIRREVHPDRVDVFLPVFFGSREDAPMKFTFFRDGTLTDHGRTLAELEKKVQDISPYLPKIQKILEHCGTCRLVGGRKLTVSQYQTLFRGEESAPDYLGGLKSMLKAVALISVLPQQEVAP